MSQSGMSPVRSFTAVVPMRVALPPELALLLAPVLMAEPSAVDAYMGHAEGVVLDDEGRVVAFVVRLATKLADRGARTLVPATAMALMEGPMLHLSWTEEKLRAQPRLDHDLRAQAPADRDPPPDSQRMLADSGAAPPGPGASGTEAAVEGVEGGLLGAALGAVAGMVLGGPIAAASMAVFFAVGGSLGGLIAGAAEETEPVVTEGNLPPSHAKEPDALGVALGHLEEKLRLDADPELAGLVRTTRITPATMVEPAAQVAA
jgi:hypothetical protein